MTTATIRRTAQGTWLKTPHGWELISQSHPLYPKGR